MTKIPKQLAKNKITSLNLKNKKKTKDDINAENYLKIVKEKIGFVPNVLAAFSNFPKQFEGFTKLYNSIMLGDSGLTKLEREMIAVTVSSLNHCFYCIVAHGSAVRELSEDPQLGERLISNLEATNLAKRMVKEFGFSDKLGPLRYESNQEEVFLGHSVSQQTNISDETARIIDNEIKVLVKKGEATAKKIINARVRDPHCF